MRVYLDHAATSPIKPEVLGAMESYLKDKFGNASSIHRWGQEARKAIDEAREKIAKFFNCEPSEIIFTSGGTESDNLAILGVVDSFRDSSLAVTFHDAEGAHLARHKMREAQCMLKGQLRLQKPHLITSKIEHHAVLETCEYLEKQGLAEVTYIGVDKDGIVDPEDIKKAIKKNTILITIMYANNEVGTIQPIREIGKIIKKENRKRENKIIFHADAVQAAGYLSCDVLKLHVHLMTIAGHKIGAPKGIGALYIRKEIKIIPRLHGGAQEYGLRPGTENVAGIVALGKAVELISSNHNQVKKLRNKLAEGLLKIKDTKINGDLNNSVPHILNISFKGVEGESILLSLDQEGIAASTGSACTSGSLDPSHVIMAMHNDPIRAHSSVRFSLGEKTTRAEIDYTIKKMKQIIKRLRSFSPTYKK